GQASQVGNNHGRILRARNQLVIGTNRVGLAVTVEHAFGLVDIRLSDSGPQILEAQTIRSQGRGVRLDPYCRFLAAADRNQTHSGELGNLLRQRSVGKIFHLGKRERVRCEREGEDGGVSWIDLAIDGRVREVSGQISAACVYGGLHLLFGNVDVLVEVELQRDDR